MKIKTLIKGISAVALTTLVVTTPIFFSTIKTVITPKMSVINKDIYMASYESQNVTDGKMVSFDYGALPSSKYSVKDLLLTNVDKSNGYVFTIGSHAYAQTNLMLYNIEKDFPSIGNNQGNGNSIVNKMHNAVFNENIFESTNIEFFNFIDIVDTKEYREAANLLNKRQTSLPGTFKNEDNQFSSNYWKVKNEDGNIDPVAPLILPVVQTPSSGEDLTDYNYAPDTTSYYEFRPNDLHDTEYEKVYYRNDERTRQFVETAQWASSYASMHNSGVSLTMQGSLMLMKYNDDSGEWEFKSFSSPSNFDASGIDDTMNEFEEFFEPETV